jgi:hypothetical protein
MIPEGCPLFSLDCFFSIDVLIVVTLLGVSKIGLDYTILYPKNGERRSHFFIPLVNHHVQREHPREMCKSCWIPTRRSNWSSCGCTGHGLDLNRKHSY